MALTLAQQLDQVQTAITGILESGQSYTINGRTYTKASLQSLIDYQLKLQADITRAAGARRTVSEF